MPSVVREEKFILADIGANSNKFWYIRQYDDHNVIVENGRVGSSPQVHPKQHSSEDAATAFVDKKIREKVAKGYTQLKVVGNAPSSAKVVSGTQLESVALRDIESSSTEVQKLLKYLSKKNIHNIIESTDIKYDESSGTFTTPCGIVTPDAIAEARDLLKSMSDYVEGANFYTDAYIQLLQSYLRLIPHKVSRKLDAAEVIPNGDAMQKESQILDALEASFQSVKDSAVETTEEEKKLFDVKLDIVDDNAVISRINKLFESSKNGRHTSSNLKVKRVYSVQIKGMYDQFEAKGRKIGNIKELWHGTRVENVLSILKSGLIIPKANASFVTGRMFGNGVYTSDQSTKALNYAQGYWGHGSKDNNCFMFLCDVAMGKEYTPSGPSQNLPMKGYDSTFAKAGKSGVMNNEMIVYSLSQCNLKYLVEFSDR